MSSHDSYVWMSTIRGENICFHIRVDKVVFLNCKFVFFLLLLLEDKEDLKNKRNRHNIFKREKTAKIWQIDCISSQFKQKTASNCSPGLIHILKGLIMILCVCMCPYFAFNFGTFFYLHFNSTLTSASSLLNECSL